MDNTQTKKTKIVKGHELTGEVISAKNRNTIVVSVEHVHRHPLYKKAVRKSKHYAVHCQSAEVAVGDMVLIREVPPISKTKHFAFVEKVTK